MYEGVELLDRTVNLCSPLEDIAKQFPKIVVSICPIMSSAGE